MPTKNISKRKFLNPVASINNGSVKYYLQLSEDSDDVDENNNPVTKKEKIISGGFIVFDCRKGIELDLYSRSSTKFGRKQHRESIRKLRLLAEYANSCADEMENFWNKEFDN